MTGADPLAFIDISAPGEMFEVDSGRIAPRGKA
jgi:DNA replication and repair protein RecF